MKNAILLGGAIAAVLGLQIVSYRFGVVDGQHRERYGKCLAEMMAEVSLMNSYFIGLADKVKAAKAPAK